MKVILEAAAGEYRRACNVAYGLRFLLGTLDADAEVVVRGSDGADEEVAGTADGAGEGRVAEGQLPRLVKCGRGEHYPDCGHIGVHVGRCEVDHDGHETCSECGETFGHGDVFGGVISRPVHAVSFLRSRGYTRDSVVQWMHWCDPVLGESPYAAIVNRRGDEVLARLKSIAGEA